MTQTAIEKLGTAIVQALNEAPATDVLSILTGSFVSLTLELLRRQGHDVTTAIKIDGGSERDITIHAPKDLAVPSSTEAVAWELPDFDALSDEAIDAACSSGGFYRVDFMRAYSALRAACAKE